MPANPTDKALLKMSRMGQGCKASRCSTDPARRRWVGRYRTERLAKMGAK